MSHRRGSVGIIILLLLVAGSHIHAQYDLANSIEIMADRYNSTELIEQIESQSDITFIFNPNDLRGSITIDAKSDISIEGLLQAIVRINRLSYKNNGDQIILYRQKAKKKIPVHTINGYIEDSQSGERLIGSHLVCSINGKGTISNESGFFSLTIPRGQVELLATYIGYQDFKLALDHGQDTTIVITLYPDTYFQEIEIVGKKKKLTEQSEMSTIRLTQEELNSNPSLLGENDIIQSIQSLPGVSSTGDFTSGLIIRGGSQDQNLVRLDGVTLYNISHLLGIFSIFNTDVVKTSTLIKGAFPARYGGRLSSILDIRMNDGDLQEIRGTGTISMIASKLTLQGPIIKGKTSFIISGRRSYADLLVKPFVNIDKDSNVISNQVSPDFNFYDTYVKVQHVINADQRVYINLYKGSDNYGYTEYNPLRETQNQISWGNNLASLRWNWELNSKLFMSSSLSYLNFTQGFQYAETTRSTVVRSTSLEYGSKINDYSAAVNFDFVPSPEHYVRFGLATQRHIYDPGTSTLTEQLRTESSDTLIKRRNIRSTELNGYVEDDINIKRVSVNLGLHFSGLSVEDKTYTSLQPRLSLNYRLAKKIAFKSSYSRMTQFNYLVTSETSLFLSDLWVSSTSRIRPQDSWQVTSGLVYQSDEDIVLSAEAYYKSMTNMLSFKLGVENTFGSNINDWESQLLQGKGESYGLELFARKTKGKLNGWLAYTLSWNNRQFEGINEGKPYPFKYDSRHQFSAVGNYSVSRKINVSFQWSYAAGRYTTISTINAPASFLSDLFLSETLPNLILGVEVPQGRNNFKLSDTHRLDFSITFTKKKKHYTRIWTLGLINAYANRNPIYAKSARAPDPMGTRQVIKQIEEVSLLPIVPSIAYKFIF